MNITVDSKSLVRFINLNEKVEKLEAELAVVEGQNQMFRQLMAKQEKDLEDFEKENTELKNEVVRLRRARGGVTAINPPENLVDDSPEYGI